MITLKALKKVSMHFLLIYLCALHMIYIY